jgi:hypothetical protein
MNTIFNSIHDDFTAQIFADYFEEQNQPKIARLLLTPPSGQDTNMDPAGSYYGYGYGGQDGYGYGIGDNHGYGIGDGIGDDHGTGIGNDNGHAHTLYDYKKTFHYLQNPL